MAKIQLQDLFDEARRRFVAGGDSYSVFKDILDHALLLSGGNYGFVAEIVGGAIRQARLRVLACASTRWERESSDFFYADPGPREALAAEISVLGEEWTRGSPLICDDLGLELQKAGLVPRELPPLGSFLAVPIVRASTTVGILGIANVPWERVEAMLGDLRPVLNYCCTLIDAYRLEKSATEESEEGPG